MADFSEEIKHIHGYCKSASAPVEIIFKQFRISIKLLKQFRENLPSLERNIIMKEIIKADLELEVLLSTDVCEIRCTVCIYLLNCPLNAIPVVPWLVYAAYLMLNLSICVLSSKKPKTQEEKCLFLICITLLTFGT